MINQIKKLLPRKYHLLLLLYLIPKRARDLPLLITTITTIAVNQVNVNTKTNQRRNIRKRRRIRKIGRIRKKRNTRKIRRIRRIRRERGTRRIRNIRRRSNPLLLLLVV